MHFVKMRVNVVKRCHQLHMWSNNLIPFSVKCAAHTIYVHMEIHRYIYMYIDSYWLQRDITR